jgi:uncharacterized membrane protein YkvI
VSTAILGPTGALFVETFHIPGFVGTGLLLSASLLSRLGIIDLIAVGYGAMTWVFIIVLAIPLLTIGAWKVFGPSGRRPRA